MPCAPRSPVAAFLGTPSLRQNRSLAADSASASAWPTRRLSTGGASLAHNDILPYAFVSTHSILALGDGKFVSLLDPPNAWRDAAAACTNAGTYPVLAGEPGQRDVMLSSPIILYDYPEVAAESPGDLFDGAEIDEILTLRILTLTDEEKAEMRQADARTRQLLDRTEALTPEHMMKLHGVMRGLRAEEDWRASRGRVAVPGAGRSLRAALGRGRRRVRAAWRSGEAATAGGRRHLRPRARGADGHYRSDRAGL